MLAVSPETDICERDDLKALFYVMRSYKCRRDYVSYWSGS